MKMDTAIEQEPGCKVVRIDLKTLILLELSMKYLEKSNNQLEKF